MYTGGGGGGGGNDPTKDGEDNALETEYGKLIVYRGGGGQ